MAAGLQRLLAQLEIWSEMHLESLLSPLLHPNDGFHD